MNDRLSVHNAMAGFEPGALPPLDQLPLALAAHPDQVITHHTRDGVSTLSFAALAGRVDATRQRALAHGLGEGTRVGLVAGNRLETLVIDLVALALRWTLVHLPERQWRQTFSSLPCALDALLLEPVASALNPASPALPGRGGNEAVHLHDVLPPTRWSLAGDLEGCQVFARIMPHGAGDGVIGGVVDGPGLPEVDNETQATARARLKGSPAVVFSSGTTGRSKAIVVDGEAVLPHAMRFFGALEAGAEDRFLIFLPLSNYQQKLLVYGSILSGAGFCLSDMATVMAALKAYRPTLFLAPPVFYESAYSLSRLGADDAERRSRLHALYGGALRLACSGMAPLAPAVRAAHASAGVPLLEAYGMTEFGPICANTLAASAEGSVGRAIAPGQVRIAEDGEIIASAPRRLTRGYLADDDQADQALTYVEQSSIATGDIGEIDAAGFVWIRGRKKDIIVTSQGYKVHPGTLERTFLEIEAVRHAVVLGDGRPHLGLLIVTDEDPDAVQQLVKARVATLNSGPCAAHPIQRIRVLTEPFSVENGLLTANMKLSRPRIAGRYDAELFR